jgi:hypothetical protein
MSQPDYESNVFVLAWDCHGLESCINATEIDREKTFAVLANQTHKSESIGQIINKLTLRARFNTQRHYEIYSIAVSPEITQQDLVEQFEINPQGMADLIRARGNKIHSDRAEKSDRIKIT